MEKKTFGQRGKIKVILKDLSEASDTINRRLLLAKLDVYGFSRTSLSFTEIYLCERRQRSSIYDSFIDWTEIIIEAPESFILGLLLFNIFLNGIFLFI